MNDNRKTRHFRPAMNQIGLEQRQLLATNPAQNIVGPAFPGPTTLPARPLPPILATVMVAQQGDPALDYYNTLVAGQRAYGSDFTQIGQSLRTPIFVQGDRIPVGSTLQLQVLTGLTFWNGRSRPNFTPVSNNLEMNLKGSGQDIRIGAYTDKTFNAYNQIIRLPLDIGVSGAVPVNRTIDAALGYRGNLENVNSRNVPPGFYAFTALWSDVNARGVRDSDPVTFVFRVGNMSDTAMNSALASFSEPATRPVAVVDIVPHVVKPEFLGNTFLRLNVQFSDAVTVFGSPPRLPITINGINRWANLERNTPKTETRSLQFVYTPTVSERAATDIRTGTSLDLSSGSSLRSVGGTQAIVSLPQTSVSKISTGAYVDYQVISGDITKNTTLKAGTRYIIEGEVHVTKNVTLTIEDGVKIGIRNGRRPITNLLDASALVFDSGSKLVVGKTTRPGTAYFSAVDMNNREVPYADNGGVFFCGTYRSGSRQGVTVDLAKTRGLRGSFTAAALVFSYCGRTDPLGRNSDKFGGDDMDPISIIGMGPTEWNIASVESRFAGNNGFDVTNSSFTITSLVVAAPIEDGVNVTSSNVTITKNLSIEMTESPANDRELFDLEADDGRATIIINQRAYVYLNGYFGGQYDEVTLTSPDLRPIPRGRQFYHYNNYINSGPSRFWTRVD
ncbi:MAG: hypothetical protein ACKO5E_06335 [bacterium]